MPNHSRVYVSALKLKLAMQLDNRATESQDTKASEAQLLAQKATTLRAEAKARLDKLESDSSLEQLSAEEIYQLGDIYKWRTHDTGLPVDSAKAIKYFEMAA